MKDLWIVQYFHMDPAREGIVAFPNRAEAVEAAADFARDAAKVELETYEAEDLGEDYELLTTIIESVDQRMFDDAVRAWLEYQQDADPDERIAIGPSGSVSDSPWDFLPYNTQEGLGAIAELSDYGLSDVAQVLGHVAVRMQHLQRPMPMAVLKKRVTRIPESQLKRIVNALVKAGSLAKVEGGFTPGPAWTSGGAMDEAERLAAAGA